MLFANRDFLPAVRFWIRKCLSSSFPNFPRHNQRAFLLQVKAVVSRHELFNCVLEIDSRIHRQVQIFGVSIDEGNVLVTTEFDGLKKLLPYERIESDIAAKDVRAVSFGRKSGKNFWYKSYKTLSAGERLCKTVTVLNRAKPPPDFTQAAIIFKRLSLLNHWKDDAAKTKSKTLPSFAEKNPQSSYAMREDSGRA